MSETESNEVSTSTPAEGVLVVSEREPEPAAPRWRPAQEPACCGSGCADCPF